MAREAEEREKRALERLREEQEPRKAQEKAFEAPKLVLESLEKAAKNVNIVTPAR